MDWDYVIQILKETFTFNATLDLPGISFVGLAFITNLLSWNAPSPYVSPIFTWIMTGLAAIYLVIKIRNAILTGRSIKLDNELKKKTLAE